jgi:hypothetical protein
MPRQCLLCGLLEAKPQTIGPWVRCGWQIVRSSSGWSWACW